MPEKPFTVNVYKVVIKDDNDDQQLRLAIDNSFSGAIDTAFRVSIDDRSNTLNDKTHRLEHLDRRKDCYMLNFVTGVYDGPGQLSQTKQVAHFGLQQDESYAHETAMLYDPQQAYVFLEFSQRGMRSTTVIRYFQKFLLSDKCSLVPVADADAPDRARRYKTIRGLQVRAYLPEISNKDRESGVSATQALGENFGAEVISVRFYSRRDGSLILDNTWAAINALLPQNENLNELKIDGREDPFDDYSLIDLIQHREIRTLQLPINDIERKIPHEDRWDALMKIREEFLS